MIIKVKWSGSHINRTALFLLNKGDGTNFPKSGDILVMHYDGKLAVRCAGGRGRGGLVRKSQVSPRFFDLNQVWSWEGKKRTGLWRRNGTRPFVCYSCECAWDNLDSSLQFDSSRRKGRPFKVLTLSMLLTLCPCLSLPWFLILFNIFSCFLAVSSFLLKVHHRHWTSYPRVEFSEDPTWIRTFLPHLMLILLSIAKIGGTKVLQKWVISP